MIDNKYKLNSIIVGTTDGIYEVNNLGQANEISQKILYSEVPDSRKLICILFYMVHQKIQI